MSIQETPRKANSPLDKFKDLNLTSRTHPAGASTNAVELKLIEINQSTPQAEQEDKTQKKNVAGVMKKHTFNLTEKVFLDFVILAKATGNTINDYVDQMIFSEVEANKDFIKQLKRHKR